MRSLKSEAPHEARLTQVDVTVSPSGNRKLTLFSNRFEAPIKKPQLIALMQTTIQVSCLANLISKQSAHTVHVVKRSDKYSSSCTNE
jgi:hypothetical protein